MDISARAISLAVRPQMGHSGHQCSHAPGRPILHLVSSSRRPRRVRGVGYVIDSSSVRTVPLFVPCCRSFVPACACRRAARQGPSRLAVALALPLALALPGHALTARARREDQAGWDAIASLLTHSKARPLLRTAQAMRASLLASAIASTLWCNRFLAASIQDLRPYTTPRSNRKRADLIDDAGTLTDQSFAHTVQRLQVELLGRLGRDKIHGRALHRLSDCFRVAKVVLLSLRVRPNIL